MIRFCGLIEVCVEGLQNPNLSRVFDELAKRDCALSEVISFACFFGFPDELAKHGPDLLSEFIFSDEGLNVCMNSLSAAMR